MKKSFKLSNGKVCRVELKKEGYMYLVLVDGVVYKQTPNQLFAVQTFNAI